MNDARHKAGFWRQARLLKLTCAESARLQSEGLDRKLSRMERLALRLHLFICVWCRRYGQQIRLLRTALRSFPRDAADLPTASLPLEAKARIKQALRQ